MLITEYDGLTSETVVRDLTEQELAQYEIDQAYFAARRQEESEQQAARDAALKSAQAKLLALGLAENEVEAMTNG